MLIPLTKLRAPPNSNMKKSKINTSESRIDVTYALYHRD